MRSLFFALLLLNVVFFGWAHWVDAPSSAAVAPSPSNDRRLPTLALIAPSAPATSAPASTVATTAAPAPPSQSTLGARCRSLGPFTSRGAADVVSAQLQFRSLAAHRRSVTMQVGDGYAVYAIEVGDAAAQRRALTRITHAGLDQAKPDDTPGQSGRLMVGVYTEQSQAVRHAEQLRQLGFKPVLEVHQVTLDAFWLDIALSANQPTPSVNELTGTLPVAPGAPVVSFSDCPSATVSG